MLQVHKSYKLSHSLLAEMECHLRSQMMQDVEVIFLLQSLHHCIKSDESATATHTSTMDIYMNTYGKRAHPLMYHLQKHRPSLPNLSPSPAVYHNGCISALKLLPDMLNKFDQGR